MTKLIVATCYDMRNAAKIINFVITVKTDNYADLARQLDEILH